MVFSQHLVISMALRIKRIATANTSQCYNSGAPGVLGSSDISVVSLCNFRLQVLRPLVFKPGSFLELFLLLLLGDKCFAMQPRLTLYLHSSYITLLSAWFNSEELFGELGLHSLTQHLLLFL